MALVIDLKPGEKILVGEAVITNDKQRTRLHIAGDAPIMREKDIMKEDEAIQSPCSRIYFLVQCMYLSRAPEEYHDKYFEQVKLVQEAAPSCKIFIMQINDEIMGRHYYKALKLSKQLIEHERELIGYATAKSAEQ
ncbi:MAG: flagellar biosynthesis repressor FlbT [Alphaproteobacteria bacterium]|nr:flagellar biosynthesis repressor FlbT [Alphaproteobacteria bacterium]